MKNEKLHNMYIVKKKSTGQGVDNVMRPKTRSTLEFTRKDIESFLKSRKANGYCYSNNSLIWSEVFYTARDYDKTPFEIYYGIEVERDSKGVLIVTLTIEEINKETIEKTERKARFVSFHDIDYDNKVIVASVN